MPKQFDIILDECIDGIILRNETVEQCLSRYPAHATELDPYLRVVAATVQAVHVPVSAEAKVRGRQRLFVEREAQDRGAQQGKGMSWLNRLPLLTARVQWATGAAFGLFIVLGGAGTVAAASGTLPGDTLYSVKRATEQVRLVLEPSNAKKAELRVSYAERRAVEISGLIQRGNTEHLASVTDSLHADLAAAAQLAANLHDPTAVEGLQVTLQSSATRALSIIQAAMADAPAEKKPEVATIIKSSGASYGAAVDAVQDKVPTSRRTVVADRTGNVQIRVTGASIPNVENLLVTVGRIEVRLGGQGDDSWVVVSDAPKTFDLVQMADTHQFLLEQELPVGAYTKIRFTVTDARINARGTDQPVDITGENVSMSRPFTISAGNTTVVVLDFGGVASLKEKGNGQFRLSPEVTLLAQEPGVDIQATPGTPDSSNSGSSKKSGRDDSLFFTSVVITGRVQEKETTFITVEDKRIALTDQTGGQKDIRVGDTVMVQAESSANGRLVAMHVSVVPAQVVPTPVLTATPAMVAVEGRVQAIRGNGNQITVEGKTVIINRARTDVQGVLVVGAMVMVTGTLVDQDTVLAVRITADASSVNATPIPSSTVTPQILTVQGRISRMADGEWRVQGWTVVFGPSTEIRGEPAVGDLVLIVGVEGEDRRVIVARLVTVLSDPLPLPIVEPTPTANSRRPTPTATAVSPVVTPSPAEEPSDDDLRIEGILEAIEDPVHWTVDGQTILLSRRTIIEGTPFIGMRVRIEGVRRQDGAILASRISIVPLGPPPPQGTATPTPPPMQTPTATPTGSPQETPTATASLTPEPTLMPSPTPGVAPTVSPVVIFPGPVDFEGLVEAQRDEEWRVSGYVVRVTGSTEVIGVPTVGDRVRVEGIANGRGEIRAATIIAL